MIIGINGYIGSGKDTVGKLIQYLLVDKKFNNFTPYNWTIEQFEAGQLDSLELSDWYIKKFAGKLKEIASLLTGIPVEKFEDQEFKKTYLGPEWSYLEPNFGSHKFVDKAMTVREFLQKLGTEAIRTGLHSNAWVNALFSDYKIKHNEYPNWLITDTRFPNEAQAIKDRGGIVIRVNRMKTASLEDKGILHPSETSLDDWTFDHVINNNGTIEELAGKVKSFLTEFQIL